MLTVRMQRIGRRGRAHFRVVVQDSRQSPKSGKVVALLGNYDPQAKTANIKKDLAKTYLDNGAQPSQRVASLFKKEGIKLPKWVQAKGKKQGKVKNPEKLRKNQPKDAKPADKSPDSEPAETSDSSEASNSSEVSEVTEAETPKTDEQSNKATDNSDPEIAQPVEPISEESSGPSDTK